MYPLRGLNRRSAALLALASSLSAGGCGSKGHAPDALTTGRRSFDVLAVLSGDGGAPLSPTNAFTLVLDVDAQQAIAGGNGRGAVVGLTTSDHRTFRSTGPFAVADASTSACNVPQEIRYDQLSVTLAGNSLTGVASGSATISCGDCSFMVSFSATLTGTPDAMPPILRAASPITTPFDPLTLAASEPLPTSATAKLVAGDGASIDLVPQIIDGPTPIIVAFTKPDIVLRAGQGYVVAVDGLIDFAGLVDRDGPSLRIGSVAAAPTVQQDGFESATGATLGGAMVMNAAGPLPPIAGNVSLYVGTSQAPAISGGTGRSLMVRLSRPAAATKLRFAYRLVAFQTEPFFPGTVVVGSEGGAGSTALYSLPRPTGPSDPVLINGATAYLTPVGTAEVVLPASANDDVLVSIGSAGTICDGLIPSGGALLDDLKLE